MGAVRSGDAVAIDRLLTALADAVDPPPKPAPPPVRPLVRIGDVGIHITER
jgi:hypothetical protein